MLTKLVLMSKQKNPLDFSRGFRQKSLVFKPVQEMGLEPTRSHPRQILSLMRLPFRHIRISQLFQAEINCNTQLREIQHLFY